MNCYCDKCHYELIEDCEMYYTINDKVVFIGFYCRNCGNIWWAKEVLLSERDKEIITERYRNSVVY